MYSTAEAVAIAGDYPTVAAFNRTTSGGSFTALYDFYLTTVLADDALFPSRDISSLVSYAWREALVP